MRNILRSSRTSPPAGADGGQPQGGDGLRRASRPAGVTSSSSPAPNYQTVRLLHGRHRSPAEGVCVMELASMLAGEAFSDHPESVCPIIAAFLRSYNDVLDYGRRQDLYGCAAAAIGTRAPGPVERQRVRRCLAWSREACGCRHPLIAGLTKLGIPFGGRLAGETVARVAGKSAGTADDATHTEVLALIDELCAMGSDSDPAPVAAPAQLAGGSLRSSVV